MIELISEEKKDEIIDLDYQAKSKETISEITGVSTGTVFNVIKEHERDIGKANREAYRRLAKNADKSNVSFEQIHNGIKINSLLEKHGLGIDAVDNFFSILSKLQPVHNLPELLENAEQLMTINQTTGQSYDQTIQEYAEKSNELPLLTEQELIKKKNIKNLDIQYETRLKRNNLTEDDISRNNITKTNLAKYGVSAENSPQLAARVFHEIELLGYNPRKLVQFLKEADSLNDHAQTARSKKAKLEEDLVLFKEKTREELETLDLAKSFLSSYMGDIKKVTDIQEIGFETEDLLNIAKTIHKNGFTVDEFIKILDNFDDISSFIDSIITTKDSLKDDADSLSSKVNSLNQEKISLEEINKKLDSDVIDKFTKFKKEFSTFKITGPMREIYTNSGDTRAVITSSVIYLHDLQQWIEIYIRDSTIIFKIEDTKKILEKVLTRVAI